MNKILKLFWVIVLLVSNQMIAQKGVITQPLEPHPFLEISEWNVHEGNLSIEEVLADNPSIWKTEKLNVPFWEKNGIKWFKQDVVIPDSLAKLDVILYIHVDPSATVFVEGKEIFTSNGYSGKGVLSLSAKAGEKYSIQVKSKNG